MAAPIVLLVIVSAFLHAGWNSILKRRPSPENAVVGVLGIAGVSSGVLAALKGFEMPSTESLLWSLAAGVVETAYFVTLAKALARAQLGPVYTIVRGGALLVVWPISIAVFGERVTPFIALGTLLVIVGLGAAGASEARIPALEVLEQAEAEEALPPPSRNGAALARASLAPRLSQPGFLGPEGAMPGFRRSAPSFADAVDLPPETTSPGARRTFHWAVACAVFAALYQLGYKMALTKGGSPEAVVSITMLTAAAVQIVVIGRARRAAALEELRTAPLAIVGAGLVCTLGFVLFVRAMTHGGAGLLTTLRNTSILFAQGLALLAGERPKRLALIGAVLVTGGAVLLSL